MRDFVVSLVFFICIVSGVFSLVFESNFEQSSLLKRLKNNPAVMLVEDTPQSNQKADEFAGEMFKMSSNFEFYLMKFNSSGVTTILETSFNNIGNFQKALQSSSPKLSNKSLPFFGILYAAQNLPLNGTIILFMDETNEVDERLGRLALDLVLKKHIAIYIIWDENLNKVNNLLQQISVNSGGTILPSINTKFGDKWNFRTSILFTRKNIKGDINFSFPVDSDVAGLNIIINPADSSKVIVTSASGYKMYFTKHNALSRYQGELLEIHLNFSTSATPTTGLWKVEVEGAQRLYNVTVFGFTNIVAQAFVADLNDANDSVKDIVKLGVSGKISAITDIIFVDSNGQSVLSNVTYEFSDREKYVTGDNETRNINIEIDNKYKVQPLYALVKGRDVKGYTFERLGYVSSHRSLFPSDPITVEVGLGSELITTEKNHPQVFFEVTNQGNDAVTVSFTCSDQKYILQTLSTYRRVLSPLESATVTLTLNTRSGVYQDEITFSAKAGSILVQKKVLVDVTSLIYYDNTEPHIDYTYTSDCTDVIFSKCEKGTWTIEITAQDTDSGLLQLNTVPKGIYIPNSYTAGTTEAVKGLYSDSCCNPKLKIIAVDRLNNRRTYEVNAYHARWSPGAIAALVLGIILFILLIALIVWLIIRWKKPKDSYDLPTYRGGPI